MLTTKVGPISTDVESDGDVKAPLDQWRPSRVNIEQSPQDIERQRLARNKMAALAFVNQMRDKLRLGSVDELVPGYTGIPESCVIAKSVVQGTLVDANVGVVYARFTRRRWLVRSYHVRVPIPREVTEFIVAFDNGMYPELKK